MNFSKIISAIYRRSGIYYGKELQKFGLKSGLMMYIMCICDNPGMSQEDVARDLQIDKSTVAKAVRQLVDEGYITRVQSEADNREYILKATEKALTLHAHLRHTQEEWFLRITADMTEVERTVFIALLEKVRIE